MNDPRHLRRKSLLFALIAICANNFGNLLLTIGLHRVGRTLPASLEAYFRIAQNPIVDLGILLMAVWLFANLSLLSWADLSYVLPVTAAGYALSAVFGWALLGEHVSPARWGGVGLITAGAILVGRTQPRTTPDPLEEENAMRPRGC